MRAICFSGQKQNGKDTAADYLLELIEGIQQSKNKEGLFSGRWERTAFASAVKHVYCDTFGVDNKFIEDWKENPETPPGFDMNVRKSLQFIGDGFRKIKPRVWVEKPFFDKSGSKIISDGRYLNELRETTYHCGVNVLIVHPDRLNEDPNGSEAEIRPLSEWFLYNGEEGPYCDMSSPSQAYSQSHDFGWKTIKHGEPLNFANKEIAEYAHLVDYFLLNDGTINDLYKKIENSLLPYLESFFKEG